MGSSDDQHEQEGERPVGRSGARFPSARQRERFSDAEPEPTPERPSGHRGKRDKPRVGRSGARFPSQKLREKYANDEVAEPAPESRSEPRPPEPPAPEPPPPEPPPEPPPSKPPSEPPRRAERVLASPDPPDDDTSDPMEPHRLRVRPYVLTKGRTQARQDLAVETLISTDPQAPWDREQLSSEYRAVRRLCMRPRSVAEVAALLSVPLGVARVLLSDLADAGFVHVHSNAATETGRPDVDLLQRVLDALHRL